MPALAAWVLPSLILGVPVAWIAQHVHKSRGGQRQERGEIPPLPRPQSSREEEHAVYVIGDLHGDVHCAQHWVGRTGLISSADENNEHTSTWTDPTSSLVFVGDYVDKGPTSKQTVEYVKDLTEKFPSHVTALMGNHEMELLLDRDVDRHAAWGGGGFFRLSYASVHPGEYANYVPDHEWDEKRDGAVVEALYNASIEIYGDGQHQSIFVSPDANNPRSILGYVSPELRPLVQERMTLYQQRYMDTFRSGTELGSWLENRPVLARMNDTLFVHGGISSEAARHIDADGLEGINQLLAQNANEERLHDFIENTEKGRAIYDMLTFRGNHQEGACPYLPALLPSGASRLGVGHTPDDSVRLLCGGNFLALDSALSRWFRNSGNEYCPGHRELRSSNGRYRCDRINEQCEGQIIRIRNGDVELIE